MVLSLNIYKNREYLTTEAERRATKKYDKAHTRQFTLKFNLKTDKDILEKLDSVENKQGYVKALIRADIDKQNHVDE